MAPPILWAKVASLRIMRCQAAAFPEGVCFRNDRVRGVCGSRARVVQVRYMFRRLLSESVKVTRLEAEDIVEGDAAGAIPLLRSRRVGWLHALHEFKECNVLPLYCGATIRWPTNNDPSQLHHGVCCLDVSLFTCPPLNRVATQAYTQPSMG